MQYPHPTEEALVAATASTALASEFRSTWLSSSVRALKERELWDRYLRHVPPAHRDVIEMHVAGMWLPIDVAHAHYTACDRLGLSATELYDIGREVSDRLHATILSVVVRAAKSAGASPWAVLERTPRLWRRIWIGGDIALYKLGPKEARLEAYAWPVARYDYIQHGMRGVLHALIEMFCRVAYVRQLSERCTPDKLAYQISWA